MIAAAFVSGFVEGLLKKIVSSDIISSFLRGKSDTSFGRLHDKLQTMLLSVAQVLEDAEQKQLRDPRVEQWLDKLQEAMEDASDFFDEIEYDALKLKVEAVSEPDKSKVKIFSTFNFAYQKRKTDMEKILERLEILVKQRHILDLQIGVEKIQSQRPQSISSTDDYRILGRDDGQKILKGMLLSNDEVGSNKPCVIPIVGMGGIGKTTLARAVFDDDEINKHFELKAWVYVSYDSDVFKVTRSILVAVSSVGCIVEDLSVMQEKLQEILHNKKFLIVLDDVWNEDLSFWDKIKMPCKVGAQESKIIVTTRNKQVALIAGTIDPYYLDLLKEDLCFELFVKLVSGNEKFTIADSNLVRIVKILAKKCKGLPLAVKAIASVLRVTNVTEWEQIVESDILDLPFQNILPHLRLSFHYLPAHLKRCFAFCSLFPRGYEFRKEDLVLLWMANNLLQYSDENRTMKEVGYEYFDDLVSRSFFQPVSDTNKKGDIFVIHDLVVDLAILVSRKKFLCLEEDKMNDIGPMSQIQHIAFDDFNSNNSREIHNLISEATHLRTFLPVQIFSKLNASPQDVLKDLRNSKHLRYVSLAGCENLNKLPSSIGELRYLRHLDISKTSIKELPKSFCLLYNLQTLKLSNCGHLTRLPKDLHHLINLKYLYMSKCKFSTLPPLGQLPALLIFSIEDCDAVEMVGIDFYGTSSFRSFPLLEYLTFKKLPKWKEWSVPEANAEAFPKLTSLNIHACRRLTGDLPHLLPSLTKLDILDCPVLASSLPVMPTVTTVCVKQCAKIAGFNTRSGLQNLDTLEDLNLRYCDNLDFLQRSDYNSLQKLSLERISNSFRLLPLDSFPNIRKVTVRNCENLESLTLFNSLNSLSALSILRCANFTLLPDSNLHCPNLTQLAFYSCNKLKFLPEKLTTLLPSLRQLVIYSCPELESLPRYGLPFSLCELTIRNCNKLIASRKNWNLQALPNLTSFRIEYYHCEDMESFLEQGLLPTSLTSLEISDIACLKTLDNKGFQELKSLKELHIYRCCNLKSLPVKGLPPSFKGLLPPSFESFFMDDCPLLEKNYAWEADGIFNRRKICCIPQHQSYQQASSSAHQSAALY